MGLINNALDALRFKDTIIYKGDSDLQQKYDALKKLVDYYPNNEDLLSEFFIVKKGLEGENEIEYQLKKSNIGMYVLRDVKLEYEDLTAQIDYVVITPVFIYYIECKNLVGNITVNEKGDFIRELTIDGRHIKKGMYSPLRQAEAQREVVRKIWENNTSNFKKIFASNKFDYYRRVLVVAANPETILNTNKAPSNIKYKVLRADNLVRQIEYDYEHKNSTDYIENQKGMEEIAKSYLDLSVKKEINYYNYYKNKYCSDTFANIATVVQNNKDELREKLIEFRKNRANEMNIPAYYVFTNLELDQIVDKCPKSIDDLNTILSPIKVKTHGELIVNIVKGE